MKKFSIGYLVNLKRLIALALLFGLMGNLAALGFVYALNNWFLKDSMQITDYYRGYFVGLVTYASILSAYKISKCLEL